MKLSRRPRKRLMQEIVSEACRLVQTDADVRGVHIVTPARPSYRQLCRYRQAARRGHVALAVDRDGVISIRHEKG